MSTREPHPRIGPTIRERARQLRSSMTPAEVHLWQHLRLKQLDGLKFRRQHPVGPFIVDFYCAELSFAIEVDGDSHDEQAEYDVARTKWLESHSYRIIRFSNDDVLYNIEGVMMKLPGSVALLISMQVIS